MIQPESHGFPSSEFTGVGENYDPLESPRGGIPEFRFEILPEIFESREVQRLVVGPIHVQKCRSCRGGGDGVVAGGRRSGGRRILRIDLEIVRLGVCVFLLLLFFVRAFKLVYTRTGRGAGETLRVPRANGLWDAPKRV